MRKSVERDTALDESQKEQRIRETARLKAKLRLMRDTPEGKSLECRLDDYRFARVKRIIRVDDPDHPWRISKSLIPEEQTVSHVHLS